ncbi:MAG TPA: hypothetical protein VNV87_03135 [Acidimicrobiales bacterium]|nr:hypothetical protein [Acidimicrobiales bacterium]
MAVVLVAVAVPLLLAACAGAEMSGTPAQRISTWVSGAGAGSAIGAIGADNAAIDKALATHSAAGVIRTACALLSNDSSAGNSDLPTPDDQLTTALENAYQVEYSAGNNCYSGAGGNASLLRRSADERRQGAADLAQAVRRITAVTGQVPSTTTTTSPDGGSNDPFNPP